MYNTTIRLSLSRVCHIPTGFFLNIDIKSEILFNPNWFYLVYRNVIVIGLWCLKFIILLNHYTRIIAICLQTVNIRRKWHKAKCTKIILQNTVDISLHTFLNMWVYNDIKFIFEQDGTPSHYTFNCHYLNENCRSSWIWPYVNFLW